MCAVHASHATFLVDESLKVPRLEGGFRGRCGCVGDVGVEVKLGGSESQSRGNKKNNICRFQNVAPYCMCACMSHSGTRLRIHVTRATTRLEAGEEQMQALAPRIGDQVRVCVCEWDWV